MWKICEKIMFKQTFKAFSECQVCVFCNEANTEFNLHLMLH